MGNQLRTVVWVLGVLLVGMGGVSAGERGALSEGLEQQLIAEEGRMGDGLGCGEAAESTQCFP